MSNPDGAQATNTTGVEALPTVAKFRIVAISGVAVIIWMRCANQRRSVCGGSSSAGRASVCGTECRGFNPRLPPQFSKHKKSTFSNVESAGGNTRIVHAKLAALFAGGLFQQDHVAVVVQADEAQPVVFG